MPPPARRFLKQACRGWLCLPSLPAPPTITTQGFPVVGPQAVKAAKERMERERERSQRRRDAAKLTVTSYYEEHMRIRRLDEQVLKAVNEALRDSDYWRTTGFFSSVRGDNYYDHWLCLAIKE